MFEKTRNRAIILVVFLSIFNSSLLGSIRNLNFQDPFYSSSLRRLSIYCIESCNQFSTLNSSENVTVSLNYINKMAIEHVLDISRILHDLEHENAFFYAADIYDILSFLDCFETNYYNLVGSIKNDDVVCVRTLFNRIKFRLGQMVDS